MKSFLFLLALMLYVQLLYSQSTTWIRSNPENCADACIRTDLPDTPASGDRYNYIANAWTAGGVFFIQRSLLRIDLSSIPQNSQIVSAKLNLWCNVESGHQQLQSGDNQSYLRRIIQPWEENLVTWNNQPVATKENEVWLHTSLYQTEDYMDIDVTEIIKDFVEMKYENHGIMLQLLTEETYRCLVFASSDFPDSSRRPLLIVEYIDCEPPVSDFNYASEGNVINFINNSSNATGWFWDFGDGYFSNLANPEHSYIESGLYNVCLISYSDCSSDTLCKLISTCPDLNAGFSYNTDADSGIQFYDTSTNAIQWFWDFDDGFYSDLQHPLHKFNNTGLYNVCLYINNECEYDTICQEIDMRFYGIEDIKPYSDIIIYPNPSSGPFNIIYPERILIQSISIYNTTGQEVYFQKLDGDRHLNIFPNPGTGIFIIRIRTNEGVVHKKLISD